MDAPQGVTITRVREVMEDPDDVESPERGMTGRRCFPCVRWFPLGKMSRADTERTEPSPAREDLCRRP